MLDTRWQVTVAGRELGAVGQGGETQGRARFPLQGVSSGSSRPTSANSQHWPRSVFSFFILQTSSTCRDAFLMAGHQGVTREPLWKLLSDSLSPKLCDVWGFVLLSILDAQPHRGLGLGV